MGAEGEAISLCVPVAAGCHCCGLGDTDAEISEQGRGRSAPKYMIEFYEAVSPGKPTARSFYVGDGRHRFGMGYRILHSAVGHGGTICPNGTPK